MPAMTRYSGWDGTQQLPALDAGDVLDAIEDDMASLGDVEASLSNLVQQGLETPEGVRYEGLEELQAQIREEQVRLREQFDLGGPLADLARRLQEIIDRESDAVDRGGPGADADGEPGAGADDEPGAGADDEPGAGADDEPGAGADDEPGAGADDEPGADADGEPGAGADGGPGAGADGEPGAGADGGPGAGADGGPGADGDGGPGADGDGEPGTGADGAGADGEPGARADGADGDGEPGAGADGQPGAGADGQPGAGADGQPGAGGFGQPGAGGFGQPGAGGFGQPGAGGFGMGLGAIPQDVAGRVEALRDYRFVDPDAAARFADLDEGVRRVALEALLPPAVVDAQGEAGNVGETRGMLAELRDALEARGAALEAFVEKHANVFDGVGDEAAHDLVEGMREQIAAAAALADAVPWQQGQAIRELLAGAFGDADQILDIMALAGQPDGNAGHDGVRFGGTEEVDLRAALRLMAEMRGLDRLAKQMEVARNGGGADDLDPALLRDVFGTSVAEGVQQLAGVADALERDGLLRRDDDGWELTPRSIRLIGQRALSEIYAQLKRADLGNHPIPEAGRHGERLEETKPYEFGDPFHLHMGRTIMNAVAREGASSPIQLEASDFEVHRSELLTATATVVLIDLSWSMALRGAFQAAKKVALALHNLTTSQYPRDQIYVMGFAGRARELKIANLPEMQWEEDSLGTNVQHGLMMARRRLAEHRAGTRQIIMITDGEPTAHMVDGEARFAYPPSPDTIPETLREVRRCAKERITLNTFMLGDEPRLCAFTDEVARINGGRVFQASPENLGEYVVADYVRHKRHRIARSA